MKIIGISGKKGTGKSTVANMIEHICLLEKKTVIQLGFADALKNEICKEFDVPRGYLEINKDMFRVLLQQWGDLKRRIHGEDYWVSKVMATIYKSAGSVDIAVIYDVRYKNEAETLKRNNATLIRTTRIVPFLQKDKHISEVDLDDYDKWDIVISNDGTQDELLTNVSTAIKSLKIC